VDETSACRTIWPCLGPDLVGIRFTSSNRAYGAGRSLPGRGVLSSWADPRTMCIDEVLERVDSVVTREARGVFGRRFWTMPGMAGLKHRYDGGFAEMTDVAPCSSRSAGDGVCLGAIQDHTRLSIELQFLQRDRVQRRSLRQRPDADVVREFQSIREKRVLVGRQLIGIVRAHRPRQGPVPRHGPANLGKSGLPRPPSTSPTTRAADARREGRMQPASSIGFESPTPAGSGRSARSSTFSRPGLFALGAAYTAPQDPGDGFLHHRAGRGRARRRQTRPRKRPASTAWTSQHVVSDAFARHAPWDQMTSENRIALHVFRKTGSTTR